jgi:hypothetical protein
VKKLYHAAGDIVQVRRGDIALHSGCCDWTVASGFPDCFYAILLGYEQARAMLQSHAACPAAQPHLF